MPDHAIVLVTLLVLGPVAYGLWLYDVLKPEPRCKGRPCVMLYSAGYIEAHGLPRTPPGFVATKRHTGAVTVRCLPCHERHLAEKGESP